MAVNNPYVADALRAEFENDHFFSLALTNAKRNREWMEVSPIWTELLQSPQIELELNVLNGMTPVHFKNPDYARGYYAAAVRELLASDPEVLEVVGDTGGFIRKTKTGHGTLLSHSSTIGVYHRPNANANLLRERIQGLPVEVEFVPVSEIELSPSERVLAEKGNEKLEKFLLDRSLDLNTEALISIKFESVEQARLNFVTLEARGLHSVNMLDASGNPIPHSDLQEHEIGDSFSGWGDRDVVKSLAFIPAIEKLHLIKIRPKKIISDLGQSLRTLQLKQFEVSPNLQAILENSEECDDEITAVVTFGNPFRISFKSLPGQGMPVIDPDLSTFGDMNADQFKNALQEFLAKARTYGTVQLNNSMANLNMAAITTKPSVLRNIFKSKFLGAHQAILSEIRF